MDHIWRIREEDFRIYYSMNTFTVSRRENFIRIMHELVAMIFYRI